MNKRPPLRRSAPIEAESDGVIEGRNAVIEALRAGVTIDKIFIAKGETDATLGHIASTAREKGIVVVDADRRKLDGMSPTGNHQGVIAQAAAQEYVSLDDIFRVAEERSEVPLIVVCDGIEDPHNLGAIIRSAETAGAHGVIIPKRRAVCPRLSLVRRRAHSPMSAYTRQTTLRPRSMNSRNAVYGCSVQRLTVRSACMTHRLTARPPSSSARKDRGSAA